MDKIVYKNQGGPDVVAEIEIQESGACKYSIYCKVSDVSYRTAGEVNSYEAAVAITESFSKTLYALAMSEVNHV